MDVGQLAGVIAGVIVGAAFLFAGFTKVRSGDDWYRQAADMGVSRLIATPVPWVELTVGSFIALALFDPWPPLAAGLLLFVFTVLIGLRVRDGSRPPCACFGSRFDKPLGASHVMRNLVLIGLVVVTITLR